MADLKHEYEQRLDDVNQEVESAHAQVVERLHAHTPQQGRYRLQGEIARGGMGAILKVWDEDLRRALAMKVILGRVESQPPADTPQVDPSKLAHQTSVAAVAARQRESAEQARAALVEDR